jgi:hypothetical protein
VLNILVKKPVIDRTSKTVCLESEKKITPIVIRNNTWIEERSNLKVNKLSMAWSSSSVSFERCKNEGVNPRSKNLVTSVTNATTPPNIPKYSTGTNLARIIE